MRRAGLWLERGGGAARKLAATVAVADTPWTTARGLLGKASLADDDGMWLAGCGSIHMFFMRFALDAVFLDGDGRVLKVLTVRPWRVAAARGARHTLELAAGAAARLGIEPGDRLRLD